LLSFPAFNDSRRFADHWLIIRVLVWEVLVCVWNYVSIRHNSSTGRMVSFRTRDGTCMGIHLCVLCGTYSADNGVNETVPSLRTVCWW